MTTTIETKIKPNSSYSSYLACGRVEEDGRFVREGYPKDDGRLVMSVTNNGRRGASHEKHVIIEVPEGYPLHILEIGNGKQTSGWHDVLYRPSQASK